MLFNVERDLGDLIVLYVVPDAVSAIPTIRILGEEGRVLAELKANEERLVLVEAGRHQSGRCAFAIDESLAPGLSTSENLTIVEASTGLLIYRRRNKHHLSAKAVLLSAGLFPPRALNAALQPRFQYATLQLERYGHETVSQVLQLHQIESVFLSGRILYKPYEYLIDGRFDLLFYLDEPYQAFAERLIILASIEKSGQPEALLGERDAFTFRTAIEFAGSLDLADGRALKRAFRRMPDEACIAFMDPATRLLTTTGPTEMARDNAVPQALDVLANAAAVGIAGEPEFFADLVATRLGLDPSEVPAAPRFDRVGELAALLREKADIAGMIEKDLDLYAEAERAYVKAA
jgi:hypothetical protein